MEAIKLLPLVLLSALYRHDVVMGEECGTRFTDFSSSVVLAEVVLQGSVMDFSPTLYSRNMRSASVNVSNVFKGMEVLKTTGRMDDKGQVVVQSFGQENKDDCVAPEDDKFKHRDMVFFLRQSRDVKMMELSAMPLPAEGNEGQRISRSLCATCVQPPTIRRLVCKDCAREPTIRPMKAKKATMGRRARLRCVVRGKPTPTITWFKDEVPVMSGNGGATIRTAGLTSILQFSQTTSAHNGRYKCVASNGVGNTEDFVTLEVSRKIRRKQGRTPPLAVKDSPDRVECQTNLCLNGGTCYFSASLNLRQCVCQSGFEGVKCENIHTLDRAVNVTHRTTPTTTTTTTTVNSTTSQTSNAPQTETHRNRLCDGNNNMCMNGGTCLFNIDLNMTYCSCQSGITGKNCEIVPSSPPTTILTPKAPYAKTPEANTVARQCRAPMIVCLNGGACLHNPALDVEYCRCPPGFHGSRCEFLQLAPVDATNRHSASSNRTGGLPTSQSTRKTDTVTSRAVQNTSDTTHTSSASTRTSAHLTSFPQPTISSRSSTTVSKPQAVGSVLTTRKSQITPRQTSLYNSNGQRIPSYPVRRKSSLKISFCRDKHYCQNRGKCKFISKLNKKFCQCIKGYGGLRCERKLY